MRQDFVYAIRVLRRTPGVTAGALLALAVGIAANTIIFSIVNAVLLRPLPYDRPECLVVINETSPQSDQMSVSYHDYLDWRAQNTVFDDVAVRNNETFNLTGMGEPEQISGSNVTASLFDVLRVTPAAGRLFTAQDDQPGAAPVVILTHAAWQRRFQGDPSAVGRIIRLDGVARTIVGVTPRGFRYPVTDDRGEIFSPLGRILDELGDRGSHPGLTAIARLKGDATLEGARANLETIAARLSRQYPETNRNIGVRLSLYQDRVVGASRPLLLALWAAIVCVLLVACANAATLLLARAAGRTREFAIRLAVGASRGRLLRQLLVESVVLSLAAGAAGVLLAAWGLPAIVALLPADLPRTSDIALDGRVLACAALAALATGLLAGVLPAWQAGRTPVFAAAAAGAGGSRRSRTRAVVVVGQLAISQALLVAAGLLIASLGHLLQTDPGFRPEGVLTAQYYLPDAVYLTHERLVGFHDAALERIGRLPDVEAAGLITPLPFGFGSSQTNVTVEGHAESVKTDSFRASPGAFAAMGIPLKAGRVFNEQDRRTSPAILIVDERFAARFFPGENPVGRRVRAERGTTWMEIVGVVGHIDAQTLDEPGRPQIYTPLLASSLHFASVVARTRTNDPLTTLPAIRRVIHDLDPELPLFNASSMSRLVEQSTGRARMGAYFFAGFAGAAWLLAAIGLAGVVAYSITMRTRELGIRLALGAAPSTVVRGLVIYGSGLTLAGLAAGIVGGVWIARAMSSLLIGVSPMDPGVLAATSLALAATGAVASYLPARRASRIDPLRSLRAD